MEFGTNASALLGGLLLLCFISVGIVLIILGILWLVRRPGQTEASWRREERHQFPAGESSMVEIVNPVGTVEVHGEGQGEIRVHVQVVSEGASTEEAKERAERVRLHLTPAAGRLLLAADQLSPLEQPHIQVHWQVRLPPTMALRVDNTAGRVSLTALQGKADLHTAAGEIRARDCDFQAPTTLRTSSGDIQWDGTLASSEGRYEVSSSTGQVSIILPDSSAFTLAAHASVGTVSCDFPVQGSHATNIIGQHAEGVVNGGGPTLAVNTTTGNIDIGSGAETAPPAPPLQELTLPE
jgi:hypothetical protein